MEKISIAGMINRILNETTTEGMTALALTTLAIIADRQADVLERIAEIIEQRLPVLPAWAANDLDALCGSMGVSSVEAIAYAIAQARKEFAEANSGIAGSE